MGTIGDKVDVTITHKKRVTGSEVVTGKQTITCVAAAQTLGNAVFVSTKKINKKREGAKFYLGLSDKLVALKENGSRDDVYFCAKDSNDAVISYDKYDVESSNDDVATVTVIKDSGKYMQLTVNGNSVSISGTGQGPSDPYHETTRSKILRVVLIVRPAAHVSSRCKSGIRPVVGRI